MIVVSLNNVSLVLGARPIFRDLSWEIQHDQRVGLIGPNGAGKSSLLKLVTGEYEAETGGQVVKARGVTIGCLAQEPQLDTNLSAFEAALAGNPRVAELETELNQLEARLAQPAVYGDERVLARVLGQQQNLVEEYRALGGDNYAGRVRELLRGLGLSDDDCARPVGLLSGGQKKLVGLARLLLSQPAVLLLDEPDNHLDLAGKAYLEQLIQDYPGAVVLISHDRYILDAVVTHIVEIEAGRLTTFTGDYSTYRLDKAERLARQEQLYRVQQREISRIEAIIKRYSIWAKVYDNEKFAKRAQSIQKRLDKVETIDRPVLEARRMDLALSGWRGSNKVLEIKGVAKSFGAAKPLRGVDLLLRHGDRVGVIGANGAGKSVLLRTIIGELAARCRRSAPGAQRANGLLCAGTRNARSRPDTNASRTRSGLDHGGRRGVVLTQVSVCLSAVIAAHWLAIGRRTQPATVGAAGAVGRQLPAAGRADKQPRHRLRRGA